MEGFVLSINCLGWWHQNIFFTHCQIWRDPWHLVSVRSSDALKAGYVYLYGKNFQLVILFDAHMLSTNKTTQKIRNKSIIVSGFSFDLRTTKVPETKLSDLRIKKCHAEVNLAEAQKWIRNNLPVPWTHHFSLKRTILWLALELLNYSDAFDTKYLVGRYKEDKLGIVQL